MDDMKCICCGVMLTQEDKDLYEKYMPILKYVPENQMKCKSCNSTSRQLLKG